MSPITRSRRSFTKRSLCLCFNIYDDIYDDASFDPYEALAPVEGSADQYFPQISTYSRSSDQSPKTKKLAESDRGMTRSSFSVSGNAVAIVISSIFVVFLVVVVYVLTRRRQSRQSLPRTRNRFLLRIFGTDRPRTPRNLGLGNAPPFRFPNIPPRRNDPIPHPGFAESRDISMPLPPTTNDQPGSEVASSRRASGIEEIQPQQVISVIEVSSNPPSPRSILSIRKLSIQSHGSFDLSGFTILKQYPYDQEGSGESTPGASISVFPLSVCPPGEKFGNGKQ